MIEPRIFVSHSHADREFCKKLVPDLQGTIGDDTAVWYDQLGGLQGGDTWLKTIEDELQARPIFLVILSPAAMASPWVEMEINMAWQQHHSPSNTKIIPLLLHPCEIRPALRTLQIISFVPEGGISEQLAYRQGLARLWEALGMPQRPLTRPGILQLIEQVGAPSQQPPNQLIQGDLLEVQATLRASRYSGANLIYFDPPRTPRNLALPERYQAALGKRTDAYWSWFADCGAWFHENLAEHGTLLVQVPVTASALAKMILVDIFGGPQSCHQQITWDSWRRASASRNANSEEVIYFFAKDEVFTWNNVYRPFTDQELASYSVDEQGRRFRLENLTMPGGTYRAGAWNGITPPVGHKWRYSIERLDQLQAEGRIVWRQSGRPYLVHYLKETQGALLSSVWTDIPPVNGPAKQRPLLLVERLINAATKPGDQVLIPCCGLGTAIVAAEQLHRRWITSDIDAVMLSQTRERLDEIPHRQWYDVQRLEN